MVRCPTHPCRHVAYLRGHVLCVRPAPSYANGPTMVERRVRVCRLPGCVRARRRTRVGTPKMFVGTAPSWCGRDAERKFDSAPLCVVTHGLDLTGGGRRPRGMVRVFGLVTRSGAAVACLWRVQVPCSDVAWLRLPLRSCLSSVAKSIAVAANGAGQRGKLRGKSPAV